MHHAYRKAKHFKLEFDDEEGYYVADEFSGGSKRQIKRDWDDCWSNWCLNKVPRPERYLKSKLGQRWDSVWSDICRMSKQFKPYTQDRLRERFHDAIETNVQMIDGKPCYFSRWDGLQEIWHEGFYVHPETNLICQVPSRLRDKKKPKKKDSGFAQITLEYKRKISSGVFETIQDKVWYKSVPYTYMATESYQVRVYGEHFKYNWKTRMSEKVLEWHYKTEYRSVEKVGTKPVQASKKDIRDHKLNETE